MISIVIRRKGLAAIFIVAECLHAFKCFRVLSSNVIPTLKPYLFFFIQNFFLLFSLSIEVKTSSTPFSQTQNHFNIHTFSYKVNHSRASYQNSYSFQKIPKTFYTYTSLSKKYQKHFYSFKFIFKNAKKTFLSSNILNTNTWILNQVTFLINQTFLYA
jgi:hypothetical protein